MKKCEKTLNGISKDLLEWAGKSTILKTIFSNIEFPNLIAQLYNLLGDNEEKRQRSAIDLYKLIWSKHAEFGPRPPIEILTSFEYKRVFFENYRDHTVHTIVTFLLGLYFYECNDTIQNAINNNFSKTSKDNALDAFIFVWSITALYHDIGYLIENDKINTEPDFRKKLMDEFNSIIQYPLSNTAKFSSQISHDREGFVIEQNKIFVSRIIGLSSVEDDDLFDKLYNASSSTNLAESTSNGVKLYYNFASSNNTKTGRDAFRDHGICSALLLLKIWTSFSEYLYRVCKDKVCYESFGEMGTEVLQLYNNIPKYEPYIIEAAEAISLHNIDKQIWELSETNSKKLTLEQFNIHLENSKNKKAHPIAFLLRLSDEIQMWNRQYFRPVTSKDVTLHSEDMSLSVSSHNIFLRFYNDENKYVGIENNDQTEFCKLKNILKTHLDSNTIENLLRYGKQEAAEGKNDREKCDLKKETGLNTVKKANTTVIKDNNIKKLDKTNWLVGAINLDEDIHFSSFYLFQSLSCNLPQEYKQFGYENIIAIYDDFNETYYIPEEECVSVSKNLISAWEQNCMFWDNLLSIIKDKITSLKTVFANISPGSFEVMETAELYELYKKHNTIHKDLYMYARIPEALDRGNSTFTKFLKEYLRSLNPELNDDVTLNSVFEVLTYPENLSLNGQEIIELCELISQIREHDKNSSTKTFSENNRTLINMDSQIRQAIQDYSNKWAFWGYHGYRNRAIRDFNYFVEKISFDVKSNRIDEQSEKLHANLEHITRQKVLLFAKYDIDTEYKTLFKAFSKIGTIKIYRRYVQLINFYYLDMLISEIARRFNTSESVIRCMLPVEIEELLMGDVTVLQKGSERNASKVFAITISNGDFNIICGERAQQLHLQLKEKTQQSLIHRGQLQGDPVSKGKIKGIGRVLTNKNKSSFEKGNILVCIDTDPDMFEYIKLAGAVLAESGGLTCHSAIVCRELQIPCIVRVPGLLESIHDGDIVEVDADTGQIKIATSISDNIIKSLNCTKSIDVGYNIGTKASSLLRMKREGINVPDFICIPIKLLINLFKEIESDGKGGESQALITELNIALEELDAPFYAVRSSTSQEDMHDFSGAGQEFTRLHVSSEDVIPTIESLLTDLNASKRKIGGSIIVQRMIFGEISGVMFTNNPLTSENSDINEVVIETVRGGNEHLTSGSISPTRYKGIEGKIKLERKSDKWGGECSNSQLQLLEKEGRLIENLFGCPQDIEWTIVENKLYILQSRNITGTERIDASLILEHKTPNTQLCVSLYQKYALPQVLQKHMLRVAAVGKWIIDHWKNPKISLNENEIVETLLLHDIGNIVKGADENFEALFPDTYSMESFDYWINLRRWVYEHYGKTDEEATRNIAKEIGVSQRILDLIEKKQFKNNATTVECDDFVVKICAYADQRVAPEGIMSLTGRLSEARKRYQGIKNASVNRPDYKMLISCATEIEKQIFEHIDGSPDMITDTSVEKYITQLKNHKFSNLNTNE